jgi:translation initiation factor 1
MNARPAGSSLVYSTDGGRMCATCRHPVAECRCAAHKAAVPAPGKVRVSLETKGRGGKSVTVVRGLPLEPEALAALGKQLRTACGCGGTVKDQVVEVQGAHVDLVSAYLRQHGFLRPVP